MIPYDQKPVTFC